MERIKTKGIVKARYIAGRTNRTVPIVSICPSVSMDNASACSAEIGCAQLENATFSLKPWDPEKLLRPSISARRVPFNKGTTAGGQQAGPKPKSVALPTAAEFSATRASL